MAQSYLGIVTRKGLQWLVPETEGAEQRLRAKAQNACQGAYYCCWAVLQREIARDLQLQLRAEYYCEALIQLNVEAESLGPILPESDRNELFTQI